MAIGVFYSDELVHRSEPLLAVHCHEVAIRLLLKELLRPLHKFRLKDIVVVSH